jgi:hypothetical protein
VFEAINVNVVPFPVKDKIGELKEKGLKRPPNFLFVFLLDPVPVTAFSKPIFGTTYSVSSTLRSRLEVASCSKYLP